MEFYSAKEQYSCETFREVMDLEITAVFELIQTQKYKYHVFILTVDPSLYCIYAGIHPETRNDNVGLEDMKKKRSGEMGAGADR